MFKKCGGVPAVFRCHLGEEQAACAHAPDNKPVSPDSILPGRSDGFCFKGNRDGQDSDLKGDICPVPLFLPGETGGLPAPQQLPHARSLLQGASPGTGARCTRATRRARLSVTNTPRFSRKTGVSFSTGFGFFAQTCSIVPRARRTASVPSSAVSKSMVFPHACDCL